MAYREISNITHNRTFMIFIFSAIIGVILAIYGTVSNGIVESQDRQTLKEDSQYIRSQLDVVKSEIIKELSKPDNVTLNNPGNVTIVVPNSGDPPQPTDKVFAFEDISIIK